MLPQETQKRRFDIIRKIANDEGATVPETDVVFYRDWDGSVPALRFMENRRLVPEKAAGKLIDAIERLRERGYELRRPIADLLRDDIRELRVRHLRVNYRLLYALLGRDSRSGENDALGVVLLGLTKEDVVPKADLERAIEYLRRFKLDPTSHSETLND